MIIYENKIHAVGPDAAAFADDGMVILFGEGAPDELRECCYVVDVNPINGTIKAGQTMKIDGEAFRITAVGEEAPITLAGLGHCTLNFSGLDNAEMMGSIYLEAKPIPNMQIGTTIQIVE